MDKKNTMLLTVIAVATLLVAVVGATFAYFSVTNGTDSSTTTAAVNVAKVGTVTLKNATDKLYLNMSANNMAQNAQGTYYAQTENTYAATTEKTHNILTVTSAGGEADADYVCTMSLTITPEGLDKVTAAEDMTLVLGDMYSKTYKLTSTSTTVTETVDITLSGNETKTMTAQLYIKNINDKQNYLSELAGSVKVEATTLACNVPAGE